MSSLLTLVPRRDQSLFTHLLQAVVIATVLTAFSYLVGLQMDWIAEVSWLEAFAVFTSYACTFLCVVERRINYPIGAISTLAYCVLFYQFDLLASMAINAFLVVYLLYGWFRWRSDSNARPVTFMTIPQWAIHIAVAAVGYGIIVALATYFGGTLAWTDSFILAGTVLAQFMLDNKKQETWIIWALVNVLAIYTYFNVGLALVGFQYIFFLMNTVYGWVMWNKSRKAEEVPVQPAAQVALA